MLHQIIHQMIHQIFDASLDDSSVASSNALTDGSSDASADASLNDSIEAFEDSFVTLISYHHNFCRRCSMCFQLDMNIDMTSLCPHNVLCVHIGSSQGPRTH